MDNHYNGEVWEYVFDVSSGNLYDISDAQDQILFGDIKYDQEVLIDPQGLDAISTGGTAGRSGDYYTMSFDISGLELLGNWGPCP